VRAGNDEYCGCSDERVFFITRRKPKDKRISRRKEAVKARMIEFCVPAKFQRREPLIARSQKGKVIVFCAEVKKPA
jgi:hypothetical protein